jgi:pantetheine-phosphate adenylyltransferase
MDGVAKSKIWRYECFDLPQGRERNLTKALYAGSFDPVTNGHADIAIRASQLFEEVMIGVYATPSKNLMFTTNERVDLFKKTVAHRPNIKVVTYTGLTVSFAQEIGAKALIRGLRASPDFQAEFELALMNRVLTTDIDTVCLMTDREFQFVSSSLLKEASRLGGNVAELVPDHVWEALTEKLAATT